MGSVVDRDSTLGTSSMTNHISKYRAGEERLLFCRRKSVVPSSQKGIRAVPRLAKFTKASKIQASKVLDP